MTIAFDRRRAWGALALILALTAVVYSSSFANGFLSWDDPVNVTSNAAIRAITWANVRTYFTEPLLGVFSPVVYASYALDFQIGGLNPATYHATNLALHLISVVLVFAIVSRLTRASWAAIIVAALFAVHPANVAAVTPISVRSSLLYACFYLAAYLSYLTYLSYRPYLSYRSYLSFALFVLACLSKPAAVTFPVLMLLTDYYRERQITRRVLLEKLPFVAVSIAIGVLALNFRNDMATGNPMVTTLAERVTLAFYQLGFYFVKAIVPLGLSAYYPYPDRTDGSLPMTVSVAAIAVAFALAFVATDGRRRRVLLFGAGFFALHLALVLKLVPLGAEFTADRYLYVPLIGLGVLVVGMSERLPSTARSALAAAALAIIGLWSVASYRGSAAWRDDMTFYSRIIDRFPNAAVAYANRAAARLQANDVDGAWRDSTEAIRLDSMNVQGYFNRATAELLQGRPRDALNDATNAVVWDPTQAASFALRAQIYLAMQDYEHARDDAAKAIELAPNAGDVFKPLVTRGMARAMLGDGQGALADLDRAIRLQPNEPALFYNRGQVKLQLGDIPGGCADLRLAIGRTDAAALVAERCSGK